MTDTISVFLLKKIPSVTLAGEKETGGERITSLCILFYFNLEQIKIVVCCCGGFFNISLKSIPFKREVKIVKLPSYTVCIRISLMGSLHLLVSSGKKKTQPKPKEIKSSKL